MTGPVLLGTAAGVMVGLLFYALLVMEPPVAYIVGVLVSTGTQISPGAVIENSPPPGFTPWPRRGGRGRP